MTNAAKLKSLETKCDRLAELANEAPMGSPRRAALYDRMHKTAEKMRQYL